MHQGYSCCKQGITLVLCGRGCSMRPCCTAHALSSVMKPLCLEHTKGKIELVEEVEHLLSVVKGHSCSTHPHVQLGCLNVSGHARQSCWCAW